MSWPVRYDLMAPTVATTSQRLEDALGNLESKVSEMVSHAVEKAVGAMKHSLAELLHAGQDEIEAAVRRMERRITRATEHQEIMIYSMKSDLDQFQAEMRSTVRNLHAMQAQTLNKREGATAQSESVEEGTPYNDRGSYGSGGSGIWRGQKLDMPLFDGTDPDGWILRVDRYFDFYKLLTEAERLEAVVVALEGDAFKWYQWENRRHPIRRWEDLKILLLQRKDFAQLDDETYPNGFASGEKTEELQIVGKSVSPQATAVEKILTKAEGKIPENLTSSSSDYKLSGRSVAASGESASPIHTSWSQSTVSASPSGESASPTHTSWSNSRRQISNSLGNDTQLKIRESDKVDVKNTEKLEHMRSPVDNSTSAAVSASTASAFVSSTNGLFDSKPFSHSIPPNLPSSNSTEQESGNSSTINHSLTSASMTSSSTSINRPSIFASMTSSSTSINRPSIFAVKPPSFPIVPTTPSPSFSLEPVASLNFRNASVMGSSVPPANPFGSGTTVPTFGQPLVFDSKPFSHSIPPNLPSSNCTEQVFGSISIINHSLTSASMTSSSTSINSPSIFAVKSPSFPIVPTTPPPSFSLEPVASLNFRNASVMGSSVPPANPFGSGTTVPTFGQPLVSQSPPAFNFGSADLSASPFHFLGQQNQATPQNLPSFQTSNSLVNSGGSFSLGFGGGDEGNWEMVQISKNKNRRK